MVDEKDEVKKEHRKNQANGYVLGLIIKTPEESNALDLVDEIKLKYNLQLVYFRIVNSRRRLHIEVRDGV